MYTHCTPALLLSLVLPVIPLIHGDQYTVFIPSAPDNCIMFSGCRSICLFVQTDLVVWLDASADGSQMNHSSHGLPSCFHPLSDCYGKGRYGCCLCVRSVMLVPSVCVCVLCDRVIRILVYFTSYCRWFLDQWLLTDRLASLWLGKSQSNERLHLHNDCVTVVVIVHFGSIG